MNPGRPSSILKLEPNVPTELALQYGNGLNVNGKFGPQVLFTLTNNRRLYVDPKIAEEIRALSLAPGQPFIITKAQKQGQRSFDWLVERKPAHFSPTPNSPESGVKTATQIEHALKTAIAAACSAERFGSEIGYPVKFSEQSIKSIACTVLIQMAKAS